MALRVLYHGTNSENAKKICKGINVKRGNEKTDFGKGFYTTDNFKTATIWARRKTELYGGTQAIVTLYFDEDAAKHIIKYFKDDLDWGRFIINNRNGKQYIERVAYKDNNLDGKYEITIGRIADIDIITISKELMRNDQMLESLDRILNLNYPLQIVFHTERAISYIRKITYQNI